METLEAPVTTIVEDGMIINPETGEVVGAVIPADLAGADHMTEDLALWAVRKYARIDARRQAAKQVQAEALRKLEEAEKEAFRRLMQDPDYVEAKRTLGNCDAILARCEKSEAYMDLAWKENLGRYASGQLSGKERTWRTPFGCVSLKKVPAKLKVDDEPLVIQEAMLRWPDAVKREFQISKVSKADIEELIKHPEAATALGFEVIPETEKVDVKA